MYCVQVPSGEAPRDTDLNLDASGSLPQGEVDASVPSVDGKKPKKGILSGLSFKRSSKKNMEVGYAVLTVSICDSSRSYEDGDDKIVFQSSFSCFQVACETFRGPRCSRISDMFCDSTWVPT